MQGAIFPQTSTMSGRDGDTQQLVGNPASVASFVSQKSNSPEVTITRNSKDSRKYSTMCFQPTTNRTVNIIITKGEYSNGKESLLPQTMVSSEQLHKPSVQARCCLAMLVIIILVLIGIAIFAIVKIDLKLQAQASVTAVDNNSTISSRVWDQTSLSNFTQGPDS